MNSQIYIAHKKVKVTPMNNWEYMERYHKGSIYDKKACYEGYLIEHLDSNKPNHPDHEGRIEWVDKEIFDKYHTLYKPEITAREKVKATPMTKREYLIYKGFLKTEHGDDEGYLLEYNEHRQNDGRHNGRLEWCTKEDFNKYFITD